MQLLPEVPPESRRIVTVDIARTCAILGMFVFHFVRDLEFFGLIPIGTTQQGAWYLLARLVAGAFLFLVGVNLVLAHSSEFRWSAYIWRIAQIAASAAVVSIATWFLASDRFVYFGILHMIVAASLISGLFINTRVAPLILLLLVTLVVDMAFGGQINLPYWLDWTGLSTWHRPALDFVPLFPWISITLAGMIFAKTVDLRIHPSFNIRITRLANWMSRHSLAIYLLHQPLFIGALWLVILVIERN